MTTTTQMKTTTTTTWSSTEMRSRCRRERSRKSTISSRTCIKSWRNKFSGCGSHRRLRQAGNRRRTCSRRLGPSNSKATNLLWCNQSICVHRKRIIESIFASIWWTIIVEINPHSCATRCCWQRLSDVFFSLSIKFSSSFSKIKSGEGRKSREIFKIYENSLIIFKENVILSCLMEKKCFNCE